jgi:hypothetical protein
VQFGEHGTYSHVSVSVLTVCPPYGYNDLGTFGVGLKAKIILDADWIFLHEHIFGLRSAVREQIGHAEALEPPRTRESPTTPDGWVVY